MSTMLDSEEARAHSSTTVENRTQLIDFLADETARLRSGDADATLAEG